MARGGQALTRGRRHGGKSAWELGLKTRIEAGTWEESLCSLLNSERRFQRWKWDQRQLMTNPSPLLILRQIRRQLS